MQYVLVHVLPTSIFLYIRKDSNSETQASIWVLHPVDWPGFGEISDLEAPLNASWQDGWYQSSMVVKTQEKQPSICKIVFKFTLPFICLVRHVTGSKSEAHSFTRLSEVFLFSSFQLWSGQVLKKVMQLSPNTVMWVVLSGVIAAGCGWNREEGWGGIVVPYSKWFDYSNKSVFVIESFPHDWERGIAPIVWHGENKPRQVTDDFCFWRWS